jgi:hypothetical protein
MGRIYNIPSKRVDIFGRPIITSKTPQDFAYLVRMNVNDIILFDDGTDELLEQGRTILPRYYYLFIGNRDGEYMFKPYEFDEHRINITVMQDIITSIDSIG